MAALAAVPGRRPVICLGFHAVEDTVSPLTMPVAGFASLLEAIAEAGYHGVSVAGWLQGRRVSGTPLVLTFDDGFRSVHRQALPVLDRLGFTATVFPIAAGLGRTIDWRVAGRSLPPLALMDASELRELVAAGWDVGGHTLDHRHLPDLDRPRMVDQVAGGRETLLALGFRQQTFAYPFGGVSREVHEIVVEAGFETAWTTRPGRPDLSHRHLLRRFMLPPRATPYTLRAALGPGLVVAHHALAGWATLRRRTPDHAGPTPGTWCSSFASAPPMPIRAPGADAFETRP